jgi:rhodanese-related sulfurtransferase
MLMPLASVKTIDREELRRALARGDVKLVMALNEWAFRAKRIPGSLHFNSRAELMAALAKDDEIIVYCSDFNCHASVAMYQDLIEHGYTRVRRYAGGLFDWESAGLPLEGEWVDGLDAREEKNHG